ncbi:MAG: glycosyltransferase family 4 protein [Anaerolineales bacterium]
MRILRIHPFLKSETILPGAGGMARVSVQLTLALSQAGHDVRVLPIPERLFGSYVWMLDLGQSVRVEPTLTLLSAKSLVKLAPRVIRLRPRSRNARMMLLDGMSLGALEASLRSFSPEIVHNHLARQPFPRLAREAGMRIPTVLTHHHGEAGECLQEYSRVVFNCRATQSRISAEMGLPLERTRVVYHPVAEPFLRGPILGNEMRSGIAFVGAVRDRKGIDLLMQVYEACPELRKHTLFCLGSGEALERCRSDAQRLNLPIVFEGQLPTASVQERLGSVRATVIPSRLESFSRAVTESLCCGTPVVGWADQVHETEELLGVAPGLAFDARRQSVQELAASISALLASELMGTESRQCLARAARETFTVARLLQGYLSIYHELL